MGDASTSAIPAATATSDLWRSDAGSRPPRVTVGLAVYNGEEFLEEALDSILQQTFTDFELVICDNASTDSTASICARYAAQDPRIRYFRNPVNIGGVRNENRTLFLARGEYFKLAAHDDKIAPTFLERCVAVLDSDPGVEVCATGVSFIDRHSRITETHVAFAGTDEKLHHRIRSIARWDYACEAIYGVMRTSSLRNVRPQGNHLHSDRVVLTELALRRPFHVVSEPLFLKRIFDDNARRGVAESLAWFQPELAGSNSVRLPHWRQLGDYVSMLVRARMRAAQRLWCAAELARYCWLVRARLGSDLVRASTALFCAVHAR